MIPAEKTRRLLRRVVEIGERAVGGQFENRIGIVKRKGRQLLNFRFRRFAFGDVPIINHDGQNPGLVQQVFRRPFRPSP